MVFEGKLDMVEKFRIKGDSDRWRRCCAFTSRRDVIRTPCQKFVGRLVFTHILKFQVKDSYNSRAS